MRNAEQFYMNFSALLICWQQGQNWNPVIVLFLPAFLLLLSCATKATEKTANITLRFLLRKRWQNCAPGTSSARTLQGTKMARRGLLSRRMILCAIEIGMPASFMSRSVLNAAMKTPRCLRNITSLPNISTAYPAAYRTAYRTAYRAAYR